MSNIIFTEKFLAKLTAIIRTFWWTGVREEHIYRKGSLSQSRPGRTFLPLKMKAYLA
jgi:hypothetical protein